MSWQAEKPRILITRLSALGDCILTLPLLCALRRHLPPKATIGWLVQPVAAPLLEQHEFLDEVLLVPKGWLGSPAAIAELRSRLRRWKPDITVDPQGLLKSAAAAWLSGAPRRIGFAAPQARELTPWLNNELVVPPAGHLVDRQRALLAPLGIRPEAVEFRVPADREAERRVQEFLRVSDLQGPFAILNPGAGWASKRWPVERYADVARYLAKRHGMRSVAVGAGDEERRWAAEIVGRSGGRSALAPSTTLPELTALLRRASLFVGSDTGPLHLAAAVNLPCVALYGPSRPEDSGPVGPHHVVLQKYYQPGSCRQRRRASNDALRAISVNDVTAACDEALERARSAAA